ncbi:hypothetical protein [Catellatospora sp. NPDC049609]|uniref:hypothetical protein n=1 Tax=Catellatospora sp. NPDC049609 TaxID=3155505 RepID=UPI00343FDAB6
MRSPRVLGYGLGVWLGMVAISLLLLPAEGKHEALYESIKLTTMVGLVSGFAIRYLYRRPTATGPEGVLVGLLWAAVTVAGDLGLYLGGAFNIGLDVYFTDVASSYAVLPVITGLILGLLAPRPRLERTPDPADFVAPHLIDREPSTPTPAAAPVLVAASTAQPSAAGAAAAAGAGGVFAGVPGVSGMAGVSGVAAPAAVAAADHAQQTAAAPSGALAHPLTTPIPVTAPVSAVYRDEQDKPPYIPVGNC